MLDVMDSACGGTRPGLFVIVSSHVAHVASTLTIISLDGHATFSTAHIDKVWRPYDRLQHSTEDALNDLRTPRQGPWIW